MFNTEWSEYELIPELEVLLNKDQQGLSPNTNSNLPRFISWAQQSLSKLFGLHISTNGNMNAQTKNAIQNFQRKKGLKPDGILNYKTLQLLHATRVQPPPEILLKQRYVLGSLLPDKIVSANKISVNRELQYDILGPVATGIGIGKSIIELEKDVVWYKAEDLKREAIYPFGQVDKYNNPPWKPREFKVKQALLVPVMKSLTEWENEEVVSAAFVVKYHYNGNAVGYISTDKINAKAGIGNSLVIEENIVPDPNAYSIGKDKPLAMVEVKFTYTFKPILSDPIMWMVTYRLYGNGVMAMKNEWTQGHPDLAYDDTERSGILIGKQPIMLTQ